jgi:hypothetical protein
MDQIQRLGRSGGTVSLVLSVHTEPMNVRHQANRWKWQAGRENLTEGPA